jgi:hypothetical protein
MSQCPEIALDGITPDKYAALVAQAKSQGLDLSAESGSTTYQDMNFTWTYDPTAETLTIQCVEKPFFIPCTAIESRIRALTT